MVTMDRREFVRSTALCVSLAGPARAQVPTKLPLVAILWEGTRELQISSPRFQLVLESFEAAGLRPGVNVKVEHFFGDSNDARFAELAPQIVAMKPDVLVSNSGVSALALKKVCGDIPLVFVAVSSPTAFGLVTTYAHRPENITGIANNVSGMLTKRLALLCEAAPKISKVALLANSQVKLRYDLDLTEANTASKSMNIFVEPFDVTRADEIDQAFRNMRDWNADGIIMSETPIFGALSREIAEAALRARLPIVTYSPLMVTYGALMSYSAPLRETYYLVGGYVKRILAGERAGSLPVTVPARFELFVNAKTAEALGLSLPQTFLGRVDQLIE